MRDAVAFEIVSLRTKLNALTDEIASDPSSAFYAAMIESGEI
ncbi:MAG: hypothetical protein AAGB15_05735 [Pseudomonadota bacterium]